MPPTTLTTTVKPPPTKPAITKPPAPTETSTKFAYTKPPVYEDFLKQNRTEQPKSSNKAPLVIEIKDTRVHAPNMDVRKASKFEPLEIIPKNKVVNHVGNNKEEDTVSINVDNFLRNSLRYLPHVQMKDAKFGNFFVPVLPSFLLQDN